MKFAVAYMLNTKYDSAYHHESGFCTCSENPDGVPWLFIETGLIDSIEDADTKADDLFKSLSDEYMEDQHLKRGWGYFPTDYDRTLYVDHVYDDDYEGLRITELEWVLRVEILRFEE